MLKKGIISLFSLILLLGSLSPIMAASSEEIGISSQYAIVIDNETGALLYNKNKDERMYPASITKIATVIVAIELIDDINATTTITQSDIDTVWETGASAADFTVGEVVTYKDIILGALLPSGADATRALANNTCGSQEAFIEKMHDLTKKLGLKNTNFMNTTGIHDDNHYSTVNDFALILQYALKNPTFKELFQVYQYNASNGQHQWIKKVLYNARRGGINTGMILGCKSGYTDKAKHTLASLLNINVREYICVVGLSTNSDTYSHCRVNDTLALGNYIGSHYGVVNVIKEGTTLETIKIKNGVKSKYKINAASDINVVVPNEYDVNNLKYDYNFKTLKAPIKKNQEIGTLEIYNGEDLLYQTTFKADKKIAKKKTKSVGSSIMNFIFPYGLAIVLIIIYVLVLKFKPKRGYR